jgi:hypothetical protein
MRHCSVICSRIFLETVSTITGSAAIEIETSLRIKNRVAQLHRAQISISMYRSLRHVTYTDKRKM